MKPYFHPGYKRLAAALVLAGFDHTRNAGVTRWGTQVRTMLGIAFKESSGNAWHVNVNTDQAKSRDYGAWQINDHWEGPVLAKAKGIGRPAGMSNKDLFYHALTKIGWSWESYVHNAEMAKLTFDSWYEGPGFRPWVAFRNGLDDCPWNEIDQGIADFKAELAKVQRGEQGWTIERIASTFLDGLAQGRPLTR